MTEIANEARVGLANGPLVAPILGRVVGMLTARADCPIDRLDGRRARLEEPQRPDREGPVHPIDDKAG